MTLLRIGTRGSDLALVQTRTVCSMVQAAHPGVEFEEVIIRTHGDAATHQPFDIHWPAGGFTGAIEQALLRGEIDLAVHSYKDLPTAVTPGLTIAAVPPRELPHDVLVCDGEVDLTALPLGFRVGTSSPRRAAQFRYFCAGVTVHALRGNVPTRLARLEDGNLDAVVLAAAGLRRLQINPPFAIDLPLARFVPAPAQGALAVQVRESGEARNIVAAIDDAPSRQAVDAERAFLKSIGAGCHTPAAALAEISCGKISLTAQLFSDNGLRMVAGTQIGDEPVELGRKLADEIMTRFS